MPVRKSTRATPGPPPLWVGVPVGALLALRLTIYNRMLVAGLLRPALDDWVTEDGRILRAESRLEPSYVYLLQGAEARMTLTLHVPEGLKPGQVLRSALRFPGAQERGVPLALELLPAREAGRKAALFEHEFSLTLPLAGERQSAAGEGPVAAAKATYSLVAGLAGLDMIPARWLATEMLTVVYHIGAAEADTPEGGALLLRLGRTRFFKNGVLALASAQAPQWILGGLSASSGLHMALGGQTGQGRLLYIWERWLLGLIGTDLEAAPAKAPAVGGPVVSLSELSANVDADADRWFGNVVLGLARLSPRLRAAFEAAAATAPPAPPKKRPGRRKSGNVLGERGSMQR